MRNFQRSTRWTRRLLPWVLPVLCMGPLLGCKERQKEKEIEEIKKNLKAMLKNPVDMHQARVDEVQQRFTEQLNHLLAKSDDTLRAKVVKEIEEESAAMKVKLMSDEIIAVGLSPDNWTVNGEPAGILVHNQGTVPMEAVVHVGTGAPPETYPLTLTVDDGKEKKKYVYKEIGSKRITFPTVAPENKQLFVVTTDKTWSPGTHDKRKLGVRLAVSLRPYLSQLLKKSDEARREKLINAIFGGEVSDYMPIMDPEVGSVSLTPDGWTSDEGPAGVAVWNRRKAELIPEMTLTCNAPTAELPLTATFHDGEQELKFVFAKPGHRVIELPAVPAGGKKLYVVTTDKTWTAGDREVKLGVRITNPLDGALRSLLTKPDPKTRAKLIGDLFSMNVDKISILGDLVVAIGLSGDRWTVDGEPAGLAIKNPGDKPFSPQVQLSCGATGKDTPITAIVDDGSEKKTVVFNNPGTEEITLSPVEPGKEKLYIITTDKTWSPGTHDKRFLGVNVGITLGTVLNGMLAGAGEATRTKVARAVMKAESVGKHPLGNYFVAMGLSADRWTVNGEPAVMIGYNPGDAAWAPRVMMTVGAKDADLPVTVSIEDGEKKYQVIFAKADTQLVTLGEILPGKYRLYVVTTDKTWSLQPQDPRALGVNIGAAPGNSPPGVPRKKEAAAAPAAPAPAAAAAPAAAEKK